MFPETVRNNLRDAIKLRYQHIPYWYTLFFEHAVVHGGPVISPLFYRYPGIQERDTQILVGEIQYSFVKFNININIFVFTMF